MIVATSVVSHVLFDENRRDGVQFQNCPRKKVNSNVHSTFSFLLDKFGTFNMFAFKLIFVSNQTEFIMSETVYALQFTGTCGLMTAFLHLLWEPFVSNSVPFCLWCSCISFFTYFECQIKKDKLGKIVSRSLIVKRMITLLSKKCRTAELQKYIRIRSKPTLRNVVYTR